MRCVFKIYSRPRRCHGHKTIARNVRHSYTLNNCKAFRGRPTVNTKPQAHCNTRRKF